MPKFCTTLKFADAVLEPVCSDDFKAASETTKLLVGCVALMGGPGMLSGAAVDWTRQALTQLCTVFPREEKFVAALAVLNGIETASVALANACVALCKALPPEIGLASAQAVLDIGNSSTDTLNGEAVSTKLLASIGSA